MSEAAHPEARFITVELDPATTAEEYADLANAIYSVGALSDRMVAVWPDGNADVSDLDKAWASVPPWDDRDDHFAAPPRRKP